MNTLKPFLATTAQLHPKVNIKMIIMALLDRLTAFAKNEADELGISESSGSLIKEDSGVGGNLFIMFWNEIMELVKVKRMFKYLLFTVANSHQYIDASGFTSSRSNFTVCFISQFLFILLFR